MEYTITEEQEKLMPEIQRIVQEEHDKILENLKDFKGLTQGQIQQQVLIKIRKRCKKELDMEIGF